MNPREGQTSRSKRSTRPSPFAYGFVALLVALSAWVEQNRKGTQERRAPAALGIPVSDVNFTAIETSIRGKTNDLVAFTVRVRFDFAAAPENFGKLVEFYRETDVSNALAAALRRTKGFPDNLLETETKRIEEKGETFFETHLTATLAPAFVWERFSRVVCSESSDTARPWTQSCDLTDYEDSRRYVAALASRVSCTESGDRIACEVDYRGESKPVAELGKRFSATQMAFDTVENLLSSTFAQAILLAHPVPYAKSVRSAVLEFKTRRESFGLLRRIAEARPERFDATKNFSEALTAAK